MKNRIVLGLFLVLALAVAGICYCNEVTGRKRGEFLDSERNVKVCVYEAYGKNYYLSIGSYNICPSTARFCQRW